MSTLAPKLADYNKSRRVLDAAIQETEAINKGLTNRGPEDLFIYTTIHGVKRNLGNILTNDDPFGIWLHTSQTGDALQRQIRGRVNQDIEDRRKCTYTDAEKTLIRKVFGRMYPMDSEHDINRLNNYLNGR